MTKKPTTKKKKPKQKAKALGISRAIDRGCQGKQREKRQPTAGWFLTQAPCLLNTFIRPLLHLQEFPLIMPVKC